MNATIVRIGPDDLNLAIDNARAFRAMARKREQWFERDLLAEPVWNMLMELFVDGQGPYPMCISSLCTASGAPQTSALRYIRKLTEQGHILRIDDPADKRRVHVRLSTAMRTRMQHFFS